MGWNVDLRGRPFSAACIETYAELGLAQVNVCLHLRRWLQRASLPTATEIGERGYAAWHSFDERVMFSDWRLVDLYEKAPADADEACRLLEADYPAFGSAHAWLACYAGVAGVPSPPSAPAEAHFERLFGHFCTVSEIACSLLRRRVDQVEERRRRGTIVSLDDLRRPPLKRGDDACDDDDDRPQSDAEAAALTRRQSGAELWEGLDKAGRERWMRATAREPLPPVGLHGSIERATFGHNARDSMLSLAAGDPTVCLVKRRAKIQDWFNKPSATVSYDHAFPVSAFRGIYNAVAFANRQGLVLNARVGVSWYNLPNCPPDDCKGYFAQFKKNLVQWFAANGLKNPYPALVFVHERADRAGTDRFHTHMMLAVPETLREAFTSYVSKALLRVVGRDKLPKRVLWVRWRKVAAHSPGRRWPITHDQWTGVTYMLKGVNPGAGLGLNVNSNVVTVGVVTPWRYEDPGEPFAGEPWGWTETIGPGRQKTFRDGAGHAFHSLLDWQIANEALDWRDLYTDYYLDQAAGRQRPEPPVRPSAGNRPAASTLVAAPLPDPAVLARLRVLLGGSGLTGGHSAGARPPTSNPFNGLLDQPPRDDKL